MASVFPPNRFPPRRLALACALALSTLECALAQTGEVERLPPVVVVGKTAPVLEQERAEVGGFDTPLGKTPQSVTVLGADLLAATGSRTLSAAARLEAGLTDSYNTTGYLESLTVRGFELRSIGNYRRNGLAWNNQTYHASESIERIEVLKGVSGMLAGVSAPGGLVNFVSKRPLEQPSQEITLESTEHGNQRLHLDMTTRIGLNGGLRLNLAHERLRPPIEAARGERALAHLAYANNLAGGRLDLEAEWSSHRQPSVPGFGLLDRDADGVGETLPALSHARRPEAGTLSSRLNLNAQPWSLPMENQSAHLGAAFRRTLAGGWEARVAARHWRSRLDDRVAFPDGCGAAETFVYPGWCADGSVDLYDYRSENERRRMTSASAELLGRFDAPVLPTRFTLGLSHYTAAERPEPHQAYNYAGTINGFAPTAVAAAPEKTGKNTLRDERSTDFSLRGETVLGQESRLFWGIHSAQLSRRSVRSDGSRAVALTQRLATPWVGLAQSLPMLSPGAMVYASWGQGVEAEVVPNRPKDYTNPGDVLPAARSRQWEFGGKWQLNPRLTASVAFYDIRRPSAEDVPGADGRALRLANARTDRHRGVEALLAGRLGADTSVHLSAAWLDARIIASTDPARIGERSPNVPQRKLAAFLSHRLASVPGLSVEALLTHESGKRIGSPGAGGLPAWTLLDLGASYRWRHALGSTELRLAVNNATNRSAWREAPATAWGGVYLFPVTARTVRLSLTHGF
ncbi:MAG: TonB-dependent siderophore receptor [Casimicrobiaceae bacterium]